MMNQFGIEKALFSQTVAAGTVIGTIKKEIAQELGAPASMKIVAGIHDQPASAIGAGLREGSVACSMGTSECMTPVFSGMFPVKVTARQGLCSEPVWEKGKYCTLAYNPSSGLLIEMCIRDSEWVKLFEKNAEFASQMGFQIIRVDSGTPPVLPEGMSYALARKKIVDNFKRISKIAQKYGLQVVWEFEPGFLINEPKYILETYEAVNEPNFSILFDTCHGYMSAVVGARHIEPNKLTRCV